MRYELALLTDIYLALFALPVLPYAQLLRLFQTEHSVTVCVWAEYLVFIHVDF